MIAYENLRQSLRRRAEGGIKKSIPEKEGAHREAATNPQCQESPTKGIHHPDIGVTYFPAEAIPAMDVPPPPLPGAMLCQDDAQGDKEKELSLAVSPLRDTSIPGADVAALPGKTPNFHDDSAADIKATIDQVGTRSRKRKTNTKSKQANTKSKQANTKSKQANTKSKKGRKLCSEDNCTKLAQGNHAKMCKKHFRDKYPEDAAAACKIVNEKKPTCSVDNCTKLAQGNHAKMCKKCFGENHPKDAAAAHKARKDAYKLGLGHKKRCAVDNCSKQAQSNHASMCMKCFGKNHPKDAEAARKVKNAAYKALPEDVRKARARAAHTKRCAVDNCSKQAQSNHASMCMKCFGKNHPKDAEAARKIKNDAYKARQARKRAAGNDAKPAAKKTKIAED